MGYGAGYGGGPYHGGGGGGGGGQERATRTHIYTMDPLEGYKIFQHDIRTFWFSLMTSLGRVFIESTSFWGLTSLSFSSWLGGFALRFTLRARDPLEKNMFGALRLPIFLREFTERAVDRKLRGMCWSWPLIQFYLQTSMVSTMKMGKFHDYVRLPEGKANVILGRKYICGIRCWGRLESPLHLEGEVYWDVLLVLSNWVITPI